MTALLSRVFGWTIEVIVWPFQLVTYIGAGVIAGCVAWWRDIGFIARNLGDWR